MCTYKTSLTGHSPSSPLYQDAHNQSSSRDISLTVELVMTGHVLKVFFCVYIHCYERVVNVTYNTIQYIIIAITFSVDYCYLVIGYADSVLIMTADVEYLKYRFHIKDIYNTANDEILTVSCSNTYSYVLLIVSIQ